MYRATITPVRPTDTPTKNLQIRNSVQFWISVIVDPAIPIDRAILKALALPDYIKTLPNADPKIVPSAGMVFAMAMLKSSSSLESLFYASQLNYTRQSGVHMFMYWPAVAAIMQSDMTVRNLKISKRQGEYDSLASSGVIPLISYPSNISAKLLLSYARSILSMLLSDLDLRSLSDPSPEKSWTKSVLPSPLLFSIGSSYKPGKGSWFNIFTLAILIFQFQFLINVSKV